MAKSKGFFGLRRGSTRTLTFSVQDGQQITKDRVEGGKNPRTEAQMVQRMMMATASAAYANMKRIVDHSFEGVTYGQRSMSRFVQLNIEALRANYEAAGANFGYNPYQDRALVGGLYKVSEGSASPIVRANWNVEHPNGQLSVEIFNTEGDSITPASLMQSLGVGVGDMCTVLVLVDSKGAAAGADMVFHFVRFKFIATGTEPLTQNNYTQFLTIESDAEISTVVNTDGQDISVVISDANVEVGGGVLGAAIRSVKADSGWLRSTASFVKTSFPGAFNPTAAAALATYPTGPSYVLNGAQI